MYIVMNTGYRILLSLSHTFEFLTVLALRTDKQFSMLYGYCATFNLAFEYVRTYCTSMQQYVLLHWGASHFPP